jgi:hypothetical protein
MGVKENAGQDEFKDDIFDIFQEFYKCHKIPPEQ